MGLGRIRKYRLRTRYPGFARSHRHGWRGWKPERLAKMSAKRLAMWLIRNGIMEAKVADNWEGIIRQPDAEQAPEGV